MKVVNLKNPEKKPGRFADAPDLWKNKTLREQPNRRTILIARANEFTDFRGFGL